MSTRVDAISTSASTPRRAWFALAVLLLPVLLIAVDNTILAFALPSIAQDFTPSAPMQLWIVDVYSLVLATLLVMMGSLGDRIGRRRMLMTARPASRWSPLRRRSPRARVTWWPPGPSWASLVPC